MVTVAVLGDYPFIGYQVAKAIVYSAIFHILHFLLLDTLVKYTFLAIEIVFFMCIIDYP